MTWGQRLVHMLYALRDFAPLGTTIAMVALPLAVHRTTKSGSNHVLIEYERDIYWVKSLYILFWVVQKISNWVLYRHIGLVRVANFQSHEIWTAPCTF